MKNATTAERSSAKHGSTLQSTCTANQGIAWLGSATAERSEAKGRPTETEMADQSTGRYRGQAWCHKAELTWPCTCLRQIDATAHHPAANTFLPKVLSCSVCCSCASSCAAGMARVRGVPYMRGAPVVLWTAWAVIRRPWPAGGPIGHQVLLCVQRTVLQVLRPPPLLQLLPMRVPLVGWL